MNDSMPERTSASLAPASQSSSAFDNAAFQPDDVNHNHNQSKDESFGINGNDTNADKRDFEAVNMELINMAPKNGKKEVTVDFSSRPTVNHCEEYFVPVNEHRKYIRGEKLYVTADKREGKDDCKRPFLWTLGVIIAGVIILLGALAGANVFSSNEPTEISPESNITSAGIFSAHSGHKENKTSLNRTDTAYSETGRSETNTTLSKTNATPSETNVPLSERDNVIGETTMRAEVTSPKNIILIDDIIVPKVAEGALTITNMEFTPAFSNKSSNEYQELRVRMVDIIKQAIGSEDIRVDIIDMKAGSVVVSYRVYFPENETSQNPETVAQNIETFFTLRNYTLDDLNISSKPTKLKPVLNTCKTKRNKCIYGCGFDKNTLEFNCICPEKDVQCGFIDKIDHLDDEITSGRGFPSEDEPNPEDTEHVESEQRAEHNAKPEPSAEPNSKPEPSTEPKAEPESITEPKSEPEPTFKPKPEPITETNPEPTSEPKAEPEPHSELAAEPEPSAEVNPESSSEPEAEPEPSSQPKVEPEPSAEPKPEPTPEPVTEPQAEPEPSSEPQPTSEPKTSQPDFVSESETDPPLTSDLKAKPELKSDLKPSSEPKTEPEPSSEQETELEQPSEPEAQPEPTLEPQPKPETPSKPEANPEPLSEPKAEPEPSSEPKPEPDATSEPKAEPEPTSEPKAEPEPTSEPKAEPEPISEPKAEPEPTSETKAETTSVAKPISGLVPALDEESNPLEPKSEPEATSETIPEPEPKPESKAEPEPSSQAQEESNQTPVVEPESEPSPEPEPTLIPQAEPSDSPKQEPEPTSEPKLTSTTLPESEEFSSESKSGFVPQSDGEHTTEATLQAKPEDLTELKTQPELISEPNIAPESSTNRENTDITTKHPTTPQSKDDENQTEDTSPITSEEKIKASDIFNIENDSYLEADEQTTQQPGTENETEASLAVNKQNLLGSGTNAYISEKGNLLANPAEVASVTGIMEDAPTTTATNDIPVTVPVIGDSSEEDVNSVEVVSNKLNGTEITSSTVKYLPSRQDSSEENDSSSEESTTADAHMQDEQITTSSTKVVIGVDEKDSKTNPEQTSQAPDNPAQTVPNYLINSSLQLNDSLSRRQEEARMIAPVWESDDRPVSGILKEVKAETYTNEENMSPFLPEYNATNSDENENTTADIVPKEEKIEGELKNQLKETDLSELLTSMKPTYENNTYEVTEKPEEITKNFQISSMNNTFINDFADILNSESNADKPKKNRTHPAKDSRFDVDITDLVYPIPTAGSKDVRDVIISNNSSLSDDYIEGVNDVSNYAENVNKIKFLKSEE